MGRIKERREAWEKYIIKCINTEGYTDEQKTTDKELLEFLAGVWKREYIYLENLRRYGNYQRLFTEWCMGLPSAFSCEFKNYDILELAKTMGVIGKTESQQDKIIKDYWQFLGSKTLQLFRKYKITSFYL